MVDEGATTDRYLPSRGPRGMAGSISERFLHDRVTG